MNTYQSNNVGKKVDLVEALQQMRRVLERENTALLQGDAKLVGELSEEKLRLSNLIEAMEPPVDTVAAELKQLGKQVREMANTNHLLIEHMHQYYTGIMSLMIKMTGQTQTYGQTGYMNAPSKMARPTRREIIA